jgi:hypothetical protein
VIGRIEFPGPGGSATLEDDGVWTCPDPNVERHLNAAYRDFSPSQGAYGFRQLREAAEALGGKVVERTQPPPLPEGTVC